jgi:hypothetical protein
MAIPAITGSTGIVTNSLKKKMGICNRKTPNSFTTKRQLYWDITLHTESTAA